MHVAEELQDVADVVPHDVAGGGLEGLREGRVGLEAREEASVRVYAYQKGKQEHNMLKVFRI